jgi:hypothetical protein
MANGVNREHGHYRRPVDGSRTVVSSQATGRWTRAAVAGHACGFERRILGVTHRSSLARSPVPLSALSNLSSTIPILAAQRAADTLAAKTCRGLTRPRKARSQRIIHRRQFQRREKGGSAIGPTKRGKGSKIMAIADGHGLPFAVHVASASPHETKLVESTLKQRFLRETPERMIGDRAYDSDSLDQHIRNATACNSSRLTKLCVWLPQLKTVAACVDIAAVGRSSVCSLGFITFVALSFAGNTTQRISSGWCNSLALSSS